MYPAPFEYERAGSVADALSLLGEHPEAELLAGGHSLLPTMKSGLARPDVVIDISAIDELHGVERDGESVRIGALTNYATVAEDDDLHASIPAVAQAAAEIGDVQVRNRGTVGGNLAHSDPAADLPAAVLAADATIHAQSSEGSRAIPVDDFFEAVYTTALGEDELLTAIEVPTHDAGVYVKKPSPSSGYAMVGVAVVAELDGETVESVRVAVTGAVDHAMRLPAVEDALEGKPLDEGTISAAASHATDDIEEYQLMDNHHASAEFRANLLEVYTERALTKLGE